MSLLAEQTECIVAMEAYFCSALVAGFYAAVDIGTIEGATKTLSNEWSARGITVNCVAPGYVISNNTEALRNDPPRNRAILDRIPVGRWAEPKDISGAVTFLASPAARYITGITLPVDGGWLGR